MILAGTVSVVSAFGARACDDGAFPLFSCNAAHDRKYIELCAPTPMDKATGFLTYHYGVLNRDGSHGKIEFEFPRERRRSLSRFFAAAYTDNGVYIQSVRFVTGDFSYRVFTAARDSDDRAGVDVQNTETGIKTSIACTERPRFYIFDLKDVVPCDPDTPVGRACLTEPLRNR
jgi:hypothetical protein